jgi:hypothetical protein
MALGSSPTPKTAIVLFHGWHAHNLFDSQVADVIADGSEGGLFGHGYTFGGHPVACAVAVECLDIYKEQDILANTRQRSGQLLGGLQEVVKGSGICGELRGELQSFLWLNFRDFAGGSRQRKIPWEEMQARGSWF